SYMKMLYKYPQAEFPYRRLLEENARRGRDAPEYELLDTGVFTEHRYFDVFVEYAKATHNDILVRISASNRGPDPATLHLLPTLWFRNTWAWGRDPRRPSIQEDIMHSEPGILQVQARHRSLGDYLLYCEGAEELLFTENETNTLRLYGVPNPSPQVKDAFHEYLVHGNASAVNRDMEGTKAAARYARTVGPGETWVVRLRLCRHTESARSETGGSDRGKPPFAGFDEMFDTRRREADEYYEALAPVG